MNKVILMGRLTRDPEVKYSQSNNPMAIARYSIAVNRKFKREGEPDADFINCVAFGKTGEFVEKYLKKGQLINVVGSLRTGSYNDKNGKKVYTTDVIVEEHYFTDSKKDKEENTSNKKANNDNKEIDEIDMCTPVDDDLPF